MGEDVHLRSHWWIVQPSMWRFELYTYPAHRPVRELLTTTANSVLGKGAFSIFVQNEKKRPNKILRSYKNAKKAKQNITFILYKENGNA